MTQIKRTRELWDHLTEILNNKTVDYKSDVRLTGTVFARYTLNAETGKYEWVFFTTAY